MGINAFLNGFYTYRLGGALSSRFEMQKFDEVDLADLATAMLGLIFVFDAGDVKETLAMIVS
jgi:hypothetical protein